MQANIEVYNQVTWETHVLDENNPYPALSVANQQPLPPPSLLCEIVHGPNHDSPVTVEILTRRGEHVEQIVKDKVLYCFVASNGVSVTGIVKIDHGFYANPPEFAKRAREKALA